MNKLKRLMLFYGQKTLRFAKFLGNEYYRKKSYSCFKDLGVNFIGKPKYINYDVDFDLTEENKIHIGENTVITKQCLILTYDYSIECGLTAINKQDADYEMQFLQDVYIGKNCFIGMRSIILPGATIGDNCIVGAGSVIRGEVPPNTIVSGNPAIVIGNTVEWALKKYESTIYYKGTKRKK